MIKVLIYNEFLREQDKNHLASQVYPLGIHTVLKEALQDEFEIDTVTFEDCDRITEELLDNTDVLVWWGHIAHDEVPDTVVTNVQNAVLSGMGFVVLHAGHHSKPFKTLMGTSCNLTWRLDGDHEYLWVCKPAHPIAQGIGRYVFLEHEESYGEPFAIPEPEETVFIGSHAGGEVFRAGCCWHRENGKIFYFQPGHESYPTYYNPDVIKIIRNAINWAAPIYRENPACLHAERPSEG